MRNTLQVRLSLRGCFALALTAARNAIKVRLKPDAAILFTDARDRTEINPRRRLTVPLPGEARGVRSDRVQRDRLGIGAEQRGVGGSGTVTEGSRRFCFRARKPLKKNGFFAVRGSTEVRVPIEGYIRRKNEKVPFPLSPHI